ncbi:ArnT family glycosyltransferase [Streptomyces sp. NPDC005931]|uniref:ArnT family glycosyltransferase n=1 Tax=Streptomyces sp. NPDC005931 TaxID=3364737 RepID=UPI00368B475B
MTTTSAPRSAARDGTRSATVIIAAAACLLTVTVRLLGVDRSTDLFVDEVIYQEVSDSAAEGGFPRTDTGLFFLHPPGFFYLWAGWSRLLGTDTDIAGVYAGRVLNGVLAGGTAALLVLLVSRAATRGAGVVAGLLFLADPYCIRQNGLAIMETGALLWVLAGYLQLLALTRDPPPGRAVLRAAGAGLCFGLAILTKDHAALITVLPLVLALALNWGPPRRLAAVCAATAVACYGLYVTVVAAAGHFDAFWDAKTRGIRRLLGLVQDTGFNARRGNPLSERLFEELPTFWPTYVLLILAPAALAVLLRHKDRTHRLLALFHLSAGLTLAYALALGTLEEKFLYLLVVPNIAAVTVAGSDILTRHRAAARPHPRRGLLPQAATAVFVAAAVTASGISYAQSRLQADDGYVQLRTFMTAHVPRDSTVIAADGVTTRGITGWTLREDYHVKRIGITSTKVRYAVIPWKLVHDGYGRFTPGEAQRLVRNGKMLFSTHSQMYGKLALYRLPPAPAGPPEEQADARR